MPYWKQRCRHKEEKVDGKITYWEECYNVVPELFKTPDGRMACPPCYMKEAYKEKKTRRFYG